MSNYYANVETGDTLMRLTTHGHRSSFEIAQWTACKVTKDTKVFFWVGDDKHRKDAPPVTGWGSQKLFIPGTKHSIYGVVPAIETPIQVVEAFNEMRQKLWKLCSDTRSYSVEHKLSRVATMERQIYFREKLLSLYDELDAELESYTPKE